MKTPKSTIIVLLSCALLGLTASESLANKLKVFVVMSYEKTFPWCQEIREGIEEVLGNTHEIHYFYMDTKVDLVSGPQKAAEAFELYKTMQPDGVITADDNAQSMFVLPYLKNKVQTPIIFCGVNADPDEYGYPATNVSGILERLHIAESIALAQQLVPSIRSVAFITKKSPVARLILKQINTEKDNYTAEFIDFAMPKTKQEALASVRNLKNRSDLLFMETMQGITDVDGKYFKDKEMMEIVAGAFEKPTIGSNRYTVKYAALCAVVKTGQEQGSSAAKMLLEAMQGTPVSRIPIITNKYGKRIINVTVMKKMGITPRPIILQGAELVRTDQ